MAIRVDGEFRTKLSQFLQDKSPNNYSVRETIFQTKQGVEVSVDITDTVSGHYCTLFLREGGMIWVNWPGCGVVNSMNTLAFMALLSNTLMIGEKLREYLVTISL